MAFERREVSDDNTGWFARRGSGYATDWGAPVVRRALESSTRNRSDTGGRFVFRRFEKAVPPWQHDAYIEIDVLKDGTEVFDEQDFWDTVTVVYPLARVPESGIALFVEKASELAAKLDLPMSYRGERVSPEGLHVQLMEAARELKETAGPPGSDEVAIHIEMSYPR